jgi:GT2 family glycosyltransferase
MVLVSIIIPCKNRSKNLHALLKSIIKNDFNLKKCELIVVDDGSKEPISKKDLAAFERYFSKLTLIRNKESRGAAFSRNIGAKHANANFLLFIDDDNILSQDFISKLYYFLKKHPACSMVGGFSYYFCCKDKINYGAYYISFNKKDIINASFVYQTVETGQILDADFIPNAFLVKKSAYTKIGGFDINYKGAYFEDADFGLRMKKVGNIKVLPSAKIYHKRKKDEFTLNSIEKLIDYTHNFIYFYKKYTTFRFPIFLGLLRLKARFIYELIKRQRLKLALLYILVTPLELINFLKLFFWSHLNKFTDITKVLL